MAKKRLEDLWVKGKTVTITEDDGVSLDVWVQKLNRIEHRQAVRRADAARARVLSLRQDADADELWVIKGDVLAMDRDALVKTVTAEDESKIRMSVEARLAAEEEWASDNYLDGLRDAWLDTTADRFAEDPDDPEARRVFSELKRFSDAVEKESGDEIESLRASYEMMHEDELREKAVDVGIKNAADEVWYDEFRSSELWLATRDALNHRQRYYTARHELDNIQDATWVALLHAVDELRVNPVEGKASEETPTSSPSSGEPGEAATEVSSGLAIVGA